MCHVIHGDALNAVFTIKHRYFIQDVFKFLIHIIKTIKPDEFPEHLLSGSGGRLGFKPAKQNNKLRKQKK